MRYEKTLPKSLVTLLAKNRDKFEEGHTEQDDFNGAGTWSHWLYLKPGWCYPEPGAHIIHESTVREVKAALKSVRPCACADCIKEKKL